MTELAQAVGISRQTLYKRFESKEAVFKWMMVEITETSLTDIQATLRDETKPVSERLVQTYDTWAGQYIDLLRHSPHGGDVISMVKSDPKGDSKPGEEKIRKWIAALLYESGYAKSRAAARDVAFVLSCVSTGLVLSAESRAAYVAGMSRAVVTLLA